MRRLNIPFLLAAGLFHVAAHSLPAAAQAPRSPAVTVFEGARLIIGDGSAPIEDSAFIVENGRFTTVARKGQAAAPAVTTEQDIADMDLDDLVNAALLNDDDE